MVERVRRVIELPFRQPDELAEIEHQRSPAPACDKEKQVRAKECSERDHQRGDVQIE